MCFYISYIYKMKGFYFHIPQDPSPSRVLCGRDVHSFKTKFDINTANDGASVKPRRFMH